MHVLLLDRQQALWFAVYCYIRRQFFTVINNPIYALSLSENVIVCEIASSSSILGLVAKKSLRRFLVVLYDRRL